MARVLVLWRLPALQFDQLGMAFQAGDEAAALGVELGPPAEVVIGHVEDIGSAWGNLPSLGRDDVVDLVAGDLGAERQRRCGLVDDVQLGGAVVFAEAGPGPAGIGVGQGRARRRTRAQVIEPVAMAQEPSFDLAQALSPGELPEQQG